jgi:putative Holliday junction resolvase
MIYTKGQFNNEIKLNTRLIGIDVGTKRVGIAISDDKRKISTPKEIINYNEKIFEKIKVIIDENKISGIVIGFPTTMGGVEHEMSDFTKKFARKLDDFLVNKMIVFYDERLTSFEAREFFHSPISRKLSGKKNKNYYDDISASLILQGFIDSSE